MRALKAVGARLTTMVIGLICGLITTRLVIGDVGVQTYAAYAFLISLPALVPSSDFGSGAALVNRIAGSRSPDSDPEVRSTALSIFRIMIGFAVGLIIVNSILYVSGGWRLILGSVGASDDATTAAFIGITVYAFTIPLAIGSRVFLGLEKSHVLILLQGLQSPVTLLLVFLAVNVGPQMAGAYLALCAYASMLLAGIVASIGAASRLKATTRWLLSVVLSLRTIRGSKVMDVGLPLLIQTLATPLSMQLDRVILAQTSPAAEVAMYSLGAQLFIPLLGLISTAGLTLWPMFARQRAEGVPVRPVRISGLFALGAAVASAAIWIIAPFLFPLLSHGLISVSAITLLAFSLVLIVQAMLYPLGMSMMDSAGARFQVLPVLVMVVVNITLSVLFATVMGAPGPLFATAIATLTCQIVPFSVRIIRQRRRY